MGTGIYDNTFQTPNEAVDRLMELLLPAENVILQFATRHIMGWQDNAGSMRGKISLSVFEHGFTTRNGKRFGGCGLSRATIHATLKTLHEKGILIKIGEADNEGQEWELPYQNTGRIHWQELEERRAELLKKNQQRIEKAVAKRAEKRKGGQSDIPPQEASNDPQVVSPTDREGSVPHTTSGQSDIHNKPIQTHQTQKDLAQPDGSAAAVETPAPAIPEPTPEKSKRQRDPFIDVIAECAFSVEPGLKLGKDTGARCGKVKSEVLATYPHMTPEKLRTIYEWYQFKPRDPAKVVAMIGEYLKAHPQPTPKPEQHGGETITVITFQNETSAEKYARAQRERERLLAQRRALGR